MAAASSSSARGRHLLLRLLALLAVAGNAAAAGSGPVVVGKRSAVLSLRELEWGAAAVKIQGRYAQQSKAQILGEHRKAEGASRATTVLELKHHSPATISDQPAGSEGYLSRLLAADAARAASLQLPRAASLQSRQAAAQVPLTSGIRFQTLNYVTTIAVGKDSSGAAAKLNVIVDTGSDLTWVQCKPCRTCYAQQDPLFDPASSATYAAVPCNASACAASLKEATGAPGFCARGGGGGGNERCYYALGYGDGSFSRGVLATDTVGLGGANLDGFVFGCGLSNHGLFGGTAGLMGLGRTELSLVSQTASRFGGVFSYCLPATTSGDSTGSLSLGGDSSFYRNTTAVAYTRMIADPAQPPFYFMNVTGASVGGAAVTASGLGASNVLIDSGTVISRLAPSVYRAVRAEFARQFTAAGFPAAPEFSLLDTCYNLTGHDEVNVPLLTLRLEGGADVTVEAAGMLFMAKKDGSQVCLAMAGLPYEDQTPIIGNYQQKNKRVVYDTVRSGLGFADEDCSYHM
ncbi:aspartyl protease family protein At5g10770 [Aegilops tauschii subsp. strangulata]|uniref:Peptidase A1 domain-containing protein n=3 Tax=Triticinae TaxID=1648030 RepID=A0A453LR75_AEGTS|nr:aspartyl protease family protein At5g10770 [Aegilops tauschii subsp. strangulata]XP_044399006.1 aspartyl protease family protein At5g10770-like [Triticum aestivum]